MNASDDVTPPAQAAKACKRTAGSAARPAAKGSGSPGFHPGGMGGSPFGSGSPGFHERSSAATSAAASAAACAAPASASVTAGPGGARDGSGGCACSSDACSCASVGRGGSSCAYIAAVCRRASTPGWLSGQPKGACDVCARRNASISKQRTPNPERSLATRRAERTRPRCDRRLRAMRVRYAWHMRGAPARRGARRPGWFRCRRREEAAAAWPAARAPRPAPPAAPRSRRTATAPARAQRPQGPRTARPPPFASIGE